MKAPESGWLRMVFWEGDAQIEVTQCNAFNYTSATWGQIGKF